jgi:benzylsuccinate CoA-transferase BbsF subunit
MLSMALAGQTGPDRGNKGFGTVIQGSAGITHLTGWPDRPPTGTGVAYTDFFAAHVAAFAVLAALDHRRRTGEGQYIDLSQQEASLEGLDAALIAASVNGDDARRAGNRHPAAAPHGVFPCRDSDAGALDEEETGPDTVPIHAHIPASESSDAWVAIAVMTDEQWRGLVRALGSPAWSADPRFRTLLGRKAHEDDLERLVAAWTRTRTPREAEAALAAAGVPAAVVANARDLHEDPQLHHRRHFIEARHPFVRDFPLDALAYRVDGARPDPPRHAPLLGGDNAAVYGDLLGLCADDLRVLEAEGVLR